MTNPTGRDAAALPHTDAANTRDGRHRYSLSRALRSVMDRRGVALVPAGLEGEVHQEIARRSGRTAKGFYLPHGLESRALDSAAGTGAVPTILPRGNFIDALRARTVLGLLGATIGDLSPEQAGLVQVPKKSAASAPGWVGEGGAGAETHPLVNQAVTLTPHTVTGYTDLTRRMAREASPDFEDFVFDDLARSIGTEVDRVGFNGTGSGGQPTGILNAAGVNFYPLGANGAAAARTDLVELERLVGAANADAAAGARLGSATTPNGRSKLRRTDKSGTTSTGRYAWEDGTVLDYPAYATTNLPSNLVKGTSGAVCSALVYGNFADLVVNLFSAIDILFDPFKQSTSGVYRLNAYQDVDVALRHPESFQAVVDFLTT